MTTDSEWIQTRVVRWDQRNRSELPPSKSKSKVDPAQFDRALDVLQQALRASRA
ncbi:hypothetical protein [Amycolatopsis sp. H20-H5]|uniref:hypothetical protein n=1 Tax=Amycolatopsis sp. H20-H5 TaxID=3046309 RepID=UPI002DB935A7|nr:hypothetical protein [Amycolatopsis sp. H20-H5]MEC3977266.1 hypothetical protein [Amycolatopsis sp. H20-H5]